MISLWCTVSIIHLYGNTCVNYCRFRRLRSSDYEQKDEKEGHKTPTTKISEHVYDLTEENQGYHELGEINQTSNYDKLG